MTKAASHQPAKIVTQFARQLSHILADYLTNPNLGDKRHPLRDRLAIKLILTLSKSERYRTQLLFRDYYAQEETWRDFPLFNGGYQKVHAESAYFVEELLLKRLQPVAKRKSQPSNLHFLLIMLCRYSLDSHWLRTWIKRRREPAPDIHLAFFKPIAKELKQKREKLKNCCALAINNRERYGALNLIAHDNRAEIPEEISLLDVIDILPLPLNEALKSSDDDSLKDNRGWYPALVERIVVSLTEGYSLMRSCGLPPQKFSGELSIGKLRELKDLRKIAVKFLKEHDAKTYQDAYQYAFNELQHAQKTDASQSQGKQGKITKIAGFEDFFDFEGSEVGAELLKTKFVSFSSDNGYGEFVDPNIEIVEQYDPDDYSPDPLEEIERRDLITNTLNQCSTLLTPVEKYYFEHVLIERRPTQGVNSAYKDKEFSRLKAAEKNYADLDNDALNDKLIKRALEIFKKFPPSDGLDD